MTPTLLLEHLMMHPRYPELVELARAAAPTAIADQVDAATDDALRTLTALAGVMGVDSTHTTTPAGVPGWLRLGVLDALSTFLTGAGSTCRHNPEPHRPQPVCAVAWRPGLVVCMRCTHLLNAPTAKADRTCDSCGRECGGVDVDDPIWPGVVQLGPLVWQYGTCTDCKPADLPTTTGTEAVPRQRTRPRGKRGQGRGRGRR